MDFMCRYCHIEGNNLYAVDHSTVNCQDSRNPYNIKESKPQHYEGRVTHILKNQFKAQEQIAMMPQPMIGMGLTPYGPVAFGPVPLGPVPLGSVPLGSVPLGSVPLGSVPLGLGPPLAVPQSAGFVPIMMSPGTISFMPVIYL